MADDQSDREQSAGDETPFGLGMSVGLGVGLGIASGAAIGKEMGNVAIGVAMGIVFGAALGITVYWPVVVLAAAVDARDAAGWLIDDTLYWIVLPTITAWGIWGLQRVARA